MKYLLSRTPSRSGLGLLTIALPVCLIIALAVVNTRFLGLQNLSNINNQITALLIVSLGQLFVALSGGIDLSVGSVMSLTAAIVVSVAPELAVPIAVLAGAAIGLINGVGVAVFRVHPLVMTLAAMTFVQGLALTVLPVPGGGVPDYLLALVEPIHGAIPASFLWGVLAITIASLVLYRTRLGLHVFAVGGDSRSAARNGVNVVFLTILGYMISSTAAVVAGLYLAARVSSGDATIGVPFALDSVTALALGGVQLAGGTGSVLGVVLGTITLGLVTNGMNLLGVSPYLRMAFTGLLLLMAVSLQRRKVIGA